MKTNREELIQAAELSNQPGPPHNTKLTVLMLKAQLTPPDLKLVSAPHSIGATLDKTGQIAITLSFPGDTMYDPVAAVPVTITVVQTDRDRAVASADVEMRTGRAFIRPDQASDPVGFAVMKNWDEDVGGVQKLAKTVITKVKDMTADEISAYMEELKADPQFHDFLPGTHGKNGGEKPFPNPTVQFNNGLQLRFKPKGDDRYKGTAKEGAPMFCIEMRTTDDPHAKQDGVACKVMVDGQAAAKGGPTTGLPDWLKPPPEPDQTLVNDYIDAACGMTHFFCKPKLPQAFTWADPLTLEVGTALTKAHLDAKPLDNAACTHTLGGAPVTAGYAVTMSDHGKKLKVTAAATKRYLAASLEITLAVTLKPQVITWENPADIFMDEELSGTRLNATALGGAELTYTTPKGKELDEDDIAGRYFGPGPTELWVTAAASPTHAASVAPKTVPLVVKQRPQAVTWEIPDSLIAGMTGEVLRTATCLGQDSQERGVAPDISYFIGDNDILEDDTGLEAGTHEIELVIEGSKWYADYTQKVTITVAEKPEAKKTTGGGKNNRKGGR